MKVTIVAGAPHQDKAFINKNIDRQSFVIAADAGHRILDFEPDLIVGDFDSSVRPDCSCPVVTLNPVKNDSDTFDCVQRAVERGATQIEFFGALGGRIDHTLANIHALIYCAQQGIDAKIIDPGNVLYVCKDKTVIPKGTFHYFSVYSLFGPAQGLTITGAKYPLQDHYLEQYAQLTLSNEVAEDCAQAEICVKKGTLLIILSNDFA